MPGQMNMPPGPPGMMGMVRPALGPAGLQDNSSLGVVLRPAASLTPEEVLRVNLCSRALTNPRKAGKQVVLKHCHVETPQPLLLPIHTHPCHLHSHIPTTHQHMQMPPGVNGMMGPMGMGPRPPGMMGHMGPMPPGPHMGQMMQQPGGPGQPPMPPGMGPPGQPFMGGPPGSGPPSGGFRGPPPPGMGPPGMPMPPHMGMRPP